MWGVIFPGQGSQKVGMGKFLFEEFSIVRESFEEASDTLSMDFKKLCFEGDEATLSLTENTQPALLLVSTSTFRVLKQELGFKPSGAAGHSIGEFAATVTAGALRFSDGLRLVRKRGELMQSAVPVGKGGMLAVLGLNETEVSQLCQWAQKESNLSPVEPANFNSPGQVVISGDGPLIQWIQDNFEPQKIGIVPSAEKRKVRLIPLKVSAPFHCSLMKPAEDGLAPLLEDTPFSESAWPIAQNLTGELYTQGEDIRKNLVGQVTGAVRWTQCMETLSQNNLSRFIECGAGKVLKGLGKKIDPNIEILNVNTLDDLRFLEKEL